ncbi:hypothetical protein GGU11DRAFT_797477 [Lentinula aff. detonsa]|nr:hypothetical protein GGU11DRAFT_797477 [Lentinula aff. detonsa]
MIFLRLALFFSPFPVSILTEGHTALLPSLQRSPSPLTSSRPQSAIPLPYQWQTLPALLIKMLNLKSARPFVIHIPSTPAIRLRCGCAFNYGVWGH